MSFSAPEIPAQFAAAAPGLSRYADILATTAVERGLIGPREVPRIWERHILNSAVLGELVPQDAEVIDVGSGAGLPGIPLALVRPDLKVVLLEPLLRRATFLSEVIAELGLTGRVSVDRGRAEERRGNYAVDVVTSRAVAPLDRLAGWCLPLTKPGGVMLALKGSSAQEEIESSRAAIGKAGGKDAEVLTCGSGVVEPPTIVVRIVSAGSGTRRKR